jgi:glycosyltransferase involved in cell wall biosynthesis
MPKKRILLFTDWFYPGFMAGGPIQSSYSLVHDLKDYYDFSVITRNTDYLDSIPYKDIKSDAWNILPNGMRVYYFSEKNLSYPNMSKLIDNEEFDIAYLNSMYSPRFTIMPLFILGKLGKKVILAPRGMLSPKAISKKSWKKRPFLLWIKNSKMIKKICFHAISDHEAEHIRYVFGKNVEIKIAPNLPGKMEVPASIEKRKELGSVNLMNVARISPEKNLHYALEVLKNVKGKVKFDIYGPVYDYAYWEKCKELIARLPSNIEAEYMGPISKESIPQALKDVHFLFMPTQGENFGHTILESMVCGAPPIISNLTPWIGLESFKAGFDIPLEEPKKFENILKKVVSMDSREFKQWSDGTRAFASGFMNNPELLEQSIRIFA